MFKNFHNSLNSLVFSSQQPLTLTF